MDARPGSVRQTAVGAQQRLLLLLLLLLLSLMMADSEDTELCFPQLLNSSCRRSVHAPSMSVLLSVLLSSVSLLTVALNLLVIISISHFKRLHTPTNLLLLSLAFSDLFAGLLLVFQVPVIDGCWLLGDLVCVLYFVFGYVNASAGVGTMVLVSVDRYVAICEPFHYSTKVSQDRVGLSVGLCWFFSAVVQLLVLKENLRRPGGFASCSGECVAFVDPAAGLVQVLVTFIGPVAVIVVLYMRVFVVAVSQARAVRSQAATLTGKTGANKSELKAARTLGVVVVVFLICLCPYYCITLASGTSLINMSAALPVICLYFFNSCVNPLIYALFYPWFRKSIRLILTLQILRPGSSEANLLSGVTRTTRTTGVTGANKTTGGAVQ